MADYATPPAELSIVPELVAKLLEEQYPELAKEEIEPFEQGWDNVLLRIGGKHLARMPRREVAVELLRNEQMVLPKIASRLPVPIPAPIFAGRPSPEYPWPWSITPWLEGLPAAQAPLSGRGAMQLAEFWAALHSLDPALMPDECVPNPVRGVPLEARRNAYYERLEQMAMHGEPVEAALPAVWEAAISAPYSQQPTITQGDPHARNILTANGELAAVIDWGDVTRGDAASDLASFWMLVNDASVRGNAIDRYANLATHSDALEGFTALMARARGWALLYGLVLRVTGLVDHPVHAQMGLDTLRNLREPP